MSVEPNENLPQKNIVLDVKDLQRVFDEKMDENFKITEGISKGINLVDVSDNQFINDQLMRIKDAVKDDDKSFSQKFAESTKNIPLINRLVSKTVDASARSENEGKSLAVISKEIVGALSQKKTVLGGNILGIIDIRQRMINMVGMLHGLENNADSLMKDNMDPAEVFILTGLQVELGETIAQTGANINLIDSAITTAQVVSSKLNTLIPKARNLLLDGLSINALITEVNQMSEMISDTSSLVTEINSNNQRNMTKAIESTTKTLSNTKSSEVRLAITSSYEFGNKLNQKIVEMGNDQKEHVKELRSIHRDVLAGQVKELSYLSDVPEIEYSSNSDESLEVPKDVDVPSLVIN